MTGPLLAWTQKLAVQYFTFEGLKIYSLKLNIHTNFVMIVSNAFQCYYINLCYVG